MTCCITEFKDAYKAPHPQSQDVSTIPGDDEEYQLFSSSNGENVAGSLALSLGDPDEELFTLSSGDPEEVFPDPKNEASAFSESDLLAAIEGEDDSLASTDLLGEGVFLLDDTDHISLPADVDSFLY